MGPYGPYVQLGDEGEEEDSSESNAKKQAKAKPKRASLPKGVTLDNVTLDQAVGLLALPRLLGDHPDTGGKVEAGLGRFGPYVVHSHGKDKDFRSLKTSDDVLTVDLPRALELLSQPKRGKGSNKSAKTPLREMGPHPVDREPVSIYDGPYGPYVKHGKVNASLPEGVEPADLTMEQAIEALAAKAGTRGTAKGAAKGTA